MASGPIGDLINPNPHRLDEEWVIQPGLVLDHAERRAAAAKQLAEAKAELKVTEADLRSAIALDPTKYGLLKATVDAVGAAIFEQPEWTVANNAVIAAQYAVDMLDAACTALEHRKKALENLCWLQSRGYYAEPAAPRGAGDTTDPTARRAGIPRGVRQPEAYTPPEPDEPGGGFHNREFGV